MTEPKPFGRRGPSETPQTFSATARIRIRSNAARLAILLGTGVVMVGAAHVWGPTFIEFLILH